MADDVALPPYLRHASTGAWFDPLTLSASLPARVGEAVEAEKLAIIHEQVHYIQAVSTMFGAMRFLSRWESLAGLAQVKTRGRLRRSSVVEDLQRLRAAHEDRRAAIEDLALPKMLDIGDELRGFHLVEADDRRIVVFAKPGPEGSRLFPLGAHALQEGMAMSVERALGHSEAAFATAASSESWAFMYAAPAEAVRSKLGDGDDLWAVTAMLCDIALDHASPQHAFLIGLSFLAEQFGRLPRAGDLAEVHAELRAAVQMDAVDREREHLLRELAGVVTRGSGSEDPFDRSFAKLFSTVIDAFEVRRSTPHKFVEALLDPGGNLEVLERFHLPAYVVGNDLLTLANDPDLIQAVVFLMVGGHYLDCVLEEGRDQACPLRNVEHCTMERVEACGSSPWSRAAVGGEACVYRFVAHALEHAGPGAPT